MTHMKPTICPACGRTNPLVGEQGGDAWPSEGDVSICWGCGELAIFDSECHGGLRRPTVREHAEIIADPTIRHALMARMVALNGHDH